MENTKLSLALFATLLLTNAIIVRANSNENGVMDNISSLIETSCAITLYPQLCHSTISSIIGTSNLLSLKDIVQLSLSVAMDAAKLNNGNIKKLTMSVNNVSKRDRIPLHDCVKSTDRTIYELDKAIEDFREYPNKKSLTSYADDLKTFLSSAITNQVTCLDGFQDDKTEKRVLRVIENTHIHATKLCSNALALVKKLTTEIALIDEKNLKKSRKARSHVLFSNQEEGENGRREDLENGIKWPEWMSIQDQKLLESSSSEAAVDVVVAVDGSGNYKTVSEAVEAAPSKNSKRYIIKIKAGVYRENVDVPSSKRNIMFWGDGRSNTIITAYRSHGSGWSTFNSATVVAVGDGFLARDISFENTAGPANGQAVALRVGSDHSAFYRCGMLGYQDTLYVHSNRQFFVNCVVAGTVDFVFGNAAAVIQNSDLTPRKPGPNQRNMVTAQSRTDLNQNTGIVIQKCRIKATSDLEPVIKEFPSFLGRPWEEYARVVVMQTTITNVIDKKGWSTWNGDIKKPYFAEYDNNGAGANTSGRVPWSLVINEADAKTFTAERFIGGADWLPSTGFPYQLGLYN